MDPFDPESNLAELASQLERLAEVLALPEERLLTKAPDVSGWSAGEHAFHQILACDLSFKNVAALVKEKLLDAGCKSSWMKHDKVHRQIPEDFEIGNLIVRIPGSLKGERRLFMGHMDTVPLCRGAVPVHRGKRITSKTRTALGGDDRVAVAALVTLVETLLKHDLPHPPMTVLFTVGEEIGLWGARFVDPKDLGNPAMGFNIDGANPASLVIGAIGADRWEAHVHGKSAHAGLHPEGGISAALIAAKAIAEVAKRGYHGKVRKRRKEGTSNVGIVRGGEATNQVNDYVFVRGESRSHDPEFLEEITQVYRTAFDNAVESVVNGRNVSLVWVLQAIAELAAFKTVLVLGLAILLFYRREVAEVSV